MNNLRIIGNIAGFHGVKGEIKIYPLIDNLKCFHDFEELYIYPDDTLLDDPQNKLSDYKYDLKSVRFHKKFALVKLDGYNDLNSVEHFKGYVYAQLEEDLENDEFYITDLEGAIVKDIDSTEYGTVKNVSDHGQVILFIELKDEFNAKRDLMLPFVEEYIKEVNSKEKLILADIPDELLDLAR